MNKQDIDKAASALTGAINYFAPMVVALNKSEEVFASLSNALKHKAVLERDIAAMTATAEGLAKQVTDSELAIGQNRELAAQAKVEAQAQADKYVADAKAQAQAQADAFKVALAERGKRANAAAEAKILAADKAATEAQQAKEAHEAAVADMTAQRDALKNSVTALETKLATLKDQAQKFAASLVA